MESITSANLPLIPLSPLLPKRFSIASLIFSIKSENFLAATKMPPPASPAKTSPIDTFSEIQPNTFFSDSQIFSATFLIVSPTDEIVSPEPFIRSATLEKKSETFEEIVLNRSPIDSIPVTERINSTM